MIMEIVCIGLPTLINIINENPNLMTNVVLYILHVYTLIYLFIKDNLIKNNEFKVNETKVIRRTEDGKTLYNHKFIYDNQEYYINIYLSEINKEMFENKKEKKGDCVLYATLKKNDEEKDYTKEIQKYHGPLNNFNKHIKEVELNINHIIEEEEIELEMLMLEDLEMKKKEIRRGDQIQA